MIYGPFAFCSRSCSLFAPSVILSTAFSKMVHSFVSLVFEFRPENPVLNFFSSFWLTHSGLFFSCD